MAKRSINIYPDPEKEPYSIRVEMLRIPIDLPVPDQVADRIPRSELRYLRGRFLLRFFPMIPPAIGHTISYKGHRWLVVGIEHPVQISRSPKKDQFPVFDMEYLGKTDG